MLPPLPRWIETSGSVTSPFRFGLPRILGGSASTTVLSRAAQGSLTLRLARLLQPYRLTSVPRAPAGRSPCPTVWVATGMNRQFPSYPIRLAGQMQDGLFSKNKISWQIITVGYQVFPDMGICPLPWIRGKLFNMVFYHSRQMHCRLLHTGLIFHPESVQYYRPVP